MKTSQIFCGVFFLRKSDQTMPLCQNCPICQSAKRAKYYRQTTQLLTIRLSVATVIIGTLVYRGVPSHVWSMPEQFHHLPGALLPGDNRQCVESPMGFATISSTEKAMTLTTCDCILRFRTKRVLFYVNFTFVDINIELIHNVSTSQRSNTEQERGKKISSCVNRHSVDQEAFQSKIVKLQYFWIFMCIYIYIYIYIYLYIYTYIRRLRRFFVMFSLWKSYQTIPLCQNCPKGQSSKRAKYYQQTSLNFNKTAVCSHRHHLGIFVQGYTFGCSI